MSSQSKVRATAVQSKVATSSRVVSARSILKGKENWKQPKIDAKSACCRKLSRTAGLTPLLRSKDTKRFTVSSTKNIIIVLLSQRKILASTPPVGKIYRQESTQTKATSVGNPQAKSTKLILCCSHPIMNE